jgi:glycerophosphoryl diester phosphodiesterase
MKIIGHRGAPALELENTLASFQTAVKLGVDRIELDVHVTKDRQYVTLHDENLARVGGPAKRVDELTYAELQKIKLHNGERGPLLRDVLKATGNIPVYVEIKIRGHSEGICKILDEFPKRRFWISSFYHDVVLECQKLRPSIPVAFATKIHPFNTLQKAKEAGAYGITLYYIYLPLVYRRARKAGLTVMVFPLGTSWLLLRLARWFPRILRSAYAIKVLERRFPNLWDSRLALAIYKHFYPEVLLCSDHPELLVGKQQ